MSVHLIARKRLGFRNPAAMGEADKVVTVEPGKFETLPDWVEKDPLFVWAKADKSIEVLESKGQVAVTEKAAAAVKGKPAAGKKEKG